MRCAKVFALDNDCEPVWRMGKGCECIRCDLLMNIFIGFNGGSLELGPVRLQQFITYLLNAFSNCGDNCMMTIPGLINRADNEGLRRELGTLMELPS
ncbi:hypothetical protein [Vulcanisaeta sp. JCM 16159]|uniref:hypothetical protein n=1 Tax=Vulcanisaeta sp. JCM 16159 TaxID=1295371 RepID=UPI0006D197FB|nr:hypothetical protein [Vulcanisaeta sp. JCM 16159]